MARPPFQFSVNPTLPAIESLSDPINNAFYHSFDHCSPATESGLWLQNQMLMMQNKIYEIEGRVAFNSNTLGNVMETQNVLCESVVVLQNKSIEDRRDAQENIMAATDGKVIFKVL
ncbi:hypothetical protein EV2_020887 [Malus domestica]